MFWIRSLVCFAVLCVLLQSSRWGGESSLALLYFCVLNVRLLLSFFDSFSRCHGLVYDCDCAISGSYYLSFRQNEKNTYAPYLNLQVKPEKIYIILCILEGKMPFKMHKIVFFPEKSVPTLSKIFRPVTRNTLIFFIWPYIVIFLRTYLSPFKPI